MAAPPSTRRQRQAAATRQDIVRAARRLFAERGYAGTSMADVAAAAGVAVQTIYASCGSKRGLVLALLDAIDEEAGVPEMDRLFHRTASPRAQLALAARLTRQLQERCGDIISALSSAAAVEPDAAEAVAEGARRHRAGAARLARRLQHVGALRRGLSANRAAAMVAVLTSPQSYAQLVDEHGWSFDECERWVADALARLVLRE
ncbi:MAG TPA: helix-turn-helix domain-containing protein [Gemmatimonadaceae bacterium]|nr:helix-turn-helix domain-containing protein [Gemmatimonadaceae bacterium]